MNQIIKKKKIVFLLNDLDLGGVQKSIIAMVKYLTSLQQYEIDLIIWQEGGVLEGEIPATVNIIAKSYAPTLKDLKLEKTLLKKTKYLFQFLRYKWFEKVAEKPWNYYTKIEKRYDIAVSYVHRGYPLYFTIDKINATKKILWFHHGIYVATEKQKLIDEIFFNRYDTIVAISDSNKKQITGSFPALNTEVQVISNLIEVKEIEQRAGDIITDMSECPDEYNFVTVSRISEEKGIDLALAAAHKLKTKGIKFKWYFVGDGALYEEMRKYTNDKHIFDVCIFLGGKINPYPYIRLADIYMQPSYVESQCLTVYEALVLKKLVVATNIPALDEALQNGELGVLCEPNPDAMADAIEKLISNKHHKELLQKALQKYEVSNSVAYQKINDLFYI